MIRCQDIMTTDPDSCYAESTVEEVAQLMKSKNIGSVPIVESAYSQKLIGIITDRDLVIKVIAMKLKPSVTKACQVMTLAPVNCHQNEDIDKALQCMEMKQVRRIPIVDDFEKLVGIISQADIVIRLRNPKKTEEVLKEISRPIRLSA